MEKIKQVTSVPFVDLGRGFARDQHEVLERWRVSGNNGNFILGEAVVEFERAMAKFLDAKHCVSLNSGSDAIWLSLKALGIKPGDEVVTVANSFIATVWAIAAVGATPVMVDIGIDLNIDPVAIENAITNKTRAIISVHLAGNPVQLDEINRIAERHGLIHIEDAAQAIGAEYNRRKVGSRSLIAAFSLHPLKNLGVWGDGGFVVTNSDQVNIALKSLRNHGLINRDSVGEWGYNSRLDAFQAIVASVRLAKLDGLNDRRREIANFYRENLQDFLQFQYIHHAALPVFHNCIALINSEWRDELIIFAGAKGVELKVHYPIPAHKQAIEGAPRIRVPNSLDMTEKLASRIISLPVFPELTNLEIETVVRVVREFFNGK